MVDQQRLPFRPSTPVYADPCVGCTSIERADGLDYCRSTMVGASPAERAVGRFVAGLVGSCAARRVQS